MLKLVERLLVILLTFTLAQGALGQSMPLTPLAPVATDRPAIVLAQAGFEEERQEWERIVNSRDPQDFVRFIEKYPNSVFRSAADAAVLRLPPVTAPAAQPPAPAETRQEVAPAQPAVPAQPALSQTELAVAVQENLVRLGCLAGRPDGDWGPRSRQALSEYSRRRSVALTTLDPSTDVLDRLKQDTDRVCPLTCAATEVAQGDRCVRIRCDRGEELNRRGECVAVEPPPVRCGPGEVKRGNRCVDVPKPVTCGPGERLSKGRCVTVQQSPPKVVSDGCPRGAKRAKNGYCYFSPFCSAANKGLPGTDVCE